MFGRKNKVVACMVLFIVMAWTCRLYAATIITGAGATFPYPLYKKWFTEYAKVDPSVHFDYKPIGSGAGVQELLKNTVDFAASDALPTPKELKLTPDRILHIPTAIGGVAIVYNIPGTRKALQLTPEVIAEIFLGRVTKWNDPAIKRINKGANLPEHGIIVVHRADTSGTTSIFTDYLNSVSTRWRREMGKGTIVAWPVGVGCTGNQGVTVRVERTPYAIGYVELAYASEAGLSSASVRNRNGKFVAPDFRTIREAVSRSDNFKSYDTLTSLVNRPGDNSYPIVGLTWFLAYQKQKDPIKGKKLVEFLGWAISTGQDAAPFMMYAPLPKEIIEKTRRTIRTIQF